MKCLGGHSLYRAIKQMSVCPSRLEGGGGGRWGGGEGG